MPVPKLSNEGWTPILLKAFIMSMLSSTGGKRPET